MAAILPAIEMKASQAQGTSFFLRLGLRKMPKVFLRG
jgi:hypothetical protein